MAESTIDLATTAEPAYLAITNGQCTTIIVPYCIIRPLCRFFADFIPQTNSLLPSLSEILMECIWATRHC